MKWSSLFERCLSIPYREGENHVNYAFERQGRQLYIYFQHSKGAVDWRNNLDFPIRPYCRMEQRSWYAHRGFLKVWKSVEEQVGRAIADHGLEAVTVVGYSHGAALAVFCHEYVWFHRPDLHLQGLGFGCPRTVWGPFPKERWANFTVVRNINDLVTHLPPCFLGYVHVGRLVEIGEQGRYSAVDAHRPENILAELRRYEI